MSDEDRPFSPSPSPVEEYEGDSDQDWAVSGIVGESVDAFNVKRYEIKWGEGWRRKDGTNTTWEAHPGEELRRLVDRWDRRQRAKRTAAAAAQKNGLEIRVGFDEWQMLHEDRTVERARGYEELRRTRGYADPHRPVDYDAMVISLRPRADGGAGADANVNVNANVRRQVGRNARTASSATLPSRAGSRRTAREKSGTPTMSTLLDGSMSPAPEQRVVRPLPRRAANARRVESSPSPGSDSSEGLYWPRSPLGHDLSPRESLQNSWTRSLCGAASVVFVNDVNDDEIPRLPGNFEYLERKYIRAPDVLSTDRNCLVSCDCENRCLYADECDCQGPSELADQYGQKIFAYSRKGLFNFTLAPGMEIIECNESCSCEQNCSNRVAQRPRNVPIEVFRTETCGWGARAVVPLPRGKLVGIYTGRLIFDLMASRREEAHEHEGEHRSYIFDLDVREGDEDEESVARYSVDGYAQGNWTRFVNHSCEPNMLVVPVIWDTIPELNQPYLAFVATEDIPARTELTIDYDPKAAAEARKGKGKGRQRVPDGARECMCGVESCRGWVRV